ncbi:MAG: hypothetical protein JNN17_26365 [Verrucomicrobiaceae bacterium]|nr:hypothetical protein [Verrucomicrobiaceae bacterium]
MKSLLKPLCLLALPGAALAEPDFYRDVFPFLKANCVSCHNKTTTKAGLNMETPELMIKGGDSGPSIIPGKSAESLIVTASLHKEDMEMPPPNNKSGAVNLTPAEIALLKQWIDLGAKSSTQTERTVALKAFAASIDPIYTVAMTKDGRYAACGRSNDIFIYDLAARRVAAQIPDAHRALVQSLAFSPDGTRLASGSFREVKIWQVQPSKASAAPVASKPADAALVKKIADSSKLAVLASAASADGKTIATACADGSVRLWDASTAKPIIELRGNLAAAKKIAELEWTIARNTLEQAFQKSEADRIAKQNTALDELLKKANDAITSMKKVLPEKQKAVPPTTTAKNDAQKAVDDVNAKIKAVPNGKPDATLDRDLKTAQDKLITAKMSEVSALAAVSATESNIKDAEDDVKRITDSKAKNAKAIADANAAGATAKTAQDKATADLTALKQQIAKTPTKALAVGFSADAGRVAALFEDGVLRVWAAATGLVIEETSGGAAGTTTISAGPDGSFTAVKSLTLSAGGAPAWTLERTLNEKGFFADRVNAVRFSPDGKTLATGGGELSRTGDITFFDVASGKVVRTWKEKHSDTILCLDFSPDGKLLASGAADKITRVTDIASGKQVNLFEGHTHHVMSLAFRADGRVLATAGAEGVVNTWDMIIGERKKKVEGWTKEVTSLQFIGATNQIVTAAGDNKVRIVTDEGSEIRSIANLPDYMQATASTPNGAMLIGGGEDSFLRVWDGTSGKELVAFGK